MKLVSLIGFVGVAVAGLAATTNAWTITTANATQPEEVVGKHQEFVKVWTVTGATPVKSIELAAAGLVFIDFEARAEAPEAPVAGDRTEPPVTPVDTAPAGTPVDTAPAGTPVDTAPAGTPVDTAPTVAPTDAAPAVAPVEAAPTVIPATDAPDTEAPTTDASNAGSGAESLLGGVVSFAVGADTVVAKVVLSGNCTTLLDEIEVVEHDGALKIRFKNTDFTGFGYLLTQVVVTQKTTLAKVSTCGSSSVYVSEDVLVAAADSSPVLSTSGDGDVFVTAPNTDFSFASLDLKSSGSGNIQLHAASLTLSDTLWSKISGEATFGVVAKTIEVSKTIQTKISGEGNVFIQADNVQTTHIDSKISGEGEITISSNGSCVTQDIAISGEGTVTTGSILCENTKLKLSGEGVVLVQTSGTFQVPHEIDGTVQYVGTAPERITDGRAPRPTPPPRPHHPEHHGWGWGWWSDEDDDSFDDSFDDSDDARRYLPESVTQAPENVFKTYELRPVPAREATFLVLTINRNRWGSDPNEHMIISILGWDIDIGDAPLAAHTQRLAAHVHKQHGSVGVAALGVFAIAAVATVGVAVHKNVMQRRRRREYQPLLQVVTN